MCCYSRPGYVVVTALTVVNTDHSFIMTHSGHIYKVIMHALAS